MDVFEVLSKEPERYFSVVEISAAIKKPSRSTSALMKKYRLTNQVDWKEIQDRQTRKKYLYRFKDPEKMLHELNKRISELRKQSGFRFINQDTAISLLTLESLERIRTDLVNIQILLSKGGKQDASN